MEFSALINLSTYTNDIFLVFAVLLLVFVGFVLSQRSLHVIAMLGATSLVAMGVISTDDLLSVFSNRGPITVAAFFVVSGALRRTGVVDRLSDGVESLAKYGNLRARLIMLSIVLAISAIINNTPVVMILTPLVISLANRLDTVPSKLLIPLSYASIFGGTCTVIGTSTNIIVNGVAQDYGLEPFSIFEITSLGLIVGAVGISYLIFIAPYLLPERRPPFGPNEEQKSKRDFVTELYISENSPVVGKKLDETAIYGRKGVKILSIIRNNRSQRARKDSRLKAEDRVLIQSRASNVLDLRELVEPEKINQELEEKALIAGFHPTIQNEYTIMEGIVGPDSQLVGERVGSLNLRRSYDISILALHRQGESLENFETVKLKFGDTLLLKANKENLQRLFAQQDLINLTEPSAQRLRRKKSPLAILAIVMIVTLAAFNVLPIAGLAVIGAVAMVAFRCIDSQEAFKAIDWSILFLIFGMLVIGQAMQSSGAAELIVNSLAATTSSLGPWAVLAAIYVLSSILTETITNNAVAVLITPLAIGLAQQLGVDPRGFVVAIMFAGSASFATPLGYQTNTIVYGAGSYKFTDFVRVGLPLNIIIGVVVVLLIPYFWPF